MALVDLKSDLSWYSSKGIPRGYRPNADKQSTDFVYNDDLTVSARPKGYANSGIAEMYPTITTANEFQIDNNTKSFRGTARRMNQLGEGSKFPIGPVGQVHKFDLPRLGFNPVVKYEEVYGPLSNSGLADTYTLESPIDDMYNKFKVRDEAFNRGNIREPFILRGIQRDDNSDPQRFVGSNSPADIPRGGILTAIERAAIDTARMSKFLLTTKGLNFMAKQATLALMNPNREGVEGTFQQPAINANASKVVLPGNLIAQISTGFTGVHIRKHGQLPIDTPGFLPLPPSPPSNYEDIIKERNTGFTQAGKKVDPTDNNRLVLVYRELMRDKDGYLDRIGLGQEIPPLSTVLGPTAISFDGGVQVSKVSRWSITKPFATSEIAVGTGARGTQSQAGSVKFSDYQEKFTPFNYNSVYTDTVFLNEDNDFKSPLTNYLVDDFKGFKDRMFFALAPNFADISPSLLAIDNAKFFPNGGFANLKGSRLNVDYNAIQAANDIRKGAGPGFNKLVDFRAYSDTKTEVHAAFEPYAKEEDTSDAAGQGGRKEFLLTRLREDGKEGNRFNGIGDSFRAQAENLPSDIDNIPNSLTPNDVITGQPIGNITIPTEEEYGAIGKAAAARKENRNADLDFRYDGNEKYQPYQKDLDKQIGITKQTENTDGVNNLLRTYANPNPAKSEDDVPILAKYKTLAYDDISTLANKLNTNKSFIHYNRKKSGNTISFWDGIATNLDNKIAQLNKKVDDGDLIVFKFNGIVFQAYIDNISDTFSPGFSTEPDQNRADPRYLYTSFERKVQISFKVVYEKTEGKFNDPWGKLKSLADLSLPKYGGGPWAQRVDVTIGSLYKGVPMLVESISYDWDNETPWSLSGDQADKYNGMPMYTQVQLGLIYMGNIKAAAGSGYVAYG